MEDGDAWNKESTKVETSSSRDLILSEILKKNLHLQIIGNANKFK